LISIPRPVGIDVGTDTVKLFSGKRPYIMPSLIGEPSERVFVPSQDKNLISNLVLVEKTQEYYVGEMARRASEIKRSPITGGKIASVEDGLLAIKAILPFGLRDPSDTLRIVAGIPGPTGVEEKKTLAASLKGKLTIDLRNEATGETKRYEPEVECSYVLPSPFGTYYSVLRAKRERFAMDTVVIDCGRSITEILTMYDGKPSVSASRAIMHSAETMVVELARTVEERVGVTIQTQDLMLATRKGLAKLTAQGEELDITELKNQHVSRTAGIISDEVQALVGTLPSDAEIEHVMITGGCAYLFAGDLKLLLVEKGIVKPTVQITVPEDPIIANVEGLEMIAREVVS